MRAFTRFVRHLVGSVVVLSLVLVGKTCVAQDVEIPAAPDAHSRGSSVFAPSTWLVLNAPVNEQVAVKLYGFYIGKVNVPVAQIDVPVRATKFLTITPSYLYNWIPPSGLNEIASQPRAFTDSYQEHQARIDGTFTLPLRNFEISARNMFVRRFRSGPADDINRYRGRISIAHPVAVQGHIWKPFASYETFYERSNGGWNRERVWTGVTLPLTGHVFFQPSYMWERSDGSRDLQYLLLGLTVSTK
jgi:Protein of unknown function (DUF2490)